MGQELRATMSSQCRVNICLVVLTTSVYSLKRIVVCTARYPRGLDQPEEACRFPAFSLVTVRRRDDVPQRLRVPHEGEPEVNLLHHR